MGGGGSMISEPPPQYIYIYIFFFGGGAVPPIPLPPPPVPKPNYSSMKSTFWNLKGLGNFVLGSETKNPGMIVRASSDLKTTQISENGLLPQGLFLYTDQRKNTLNISGVPFMTFGGSFWHFGG